ncbi:MAG: glycosyltransferase family 4 protein [Allosphingosinicella sp.]
MRLAAFAKYGPMAASTRQRLLQYVPHLAAAGIEVDFHPLLPDDYVRGMATGERYPKRKTAAAYLKRLREIAFGTGADAIWIYAELFPYLPGLVERLALRSGKPIVFDYDDAIFHMYDSSGNPLVRALLGRKLQPLLRRASLCCCGNRYLLDYAARFSSRTMLLPTVVDADVYRPAEAPDRSRPVTIGWIGSPSTWPYVRPLLPLLRELAESRGVRIRVVGAGRAALADAFPGLDLVEWSEEREVDEVRAMDIGIMPLPDDIWARGKCGYKLIQYMACGLPVVASPVGVNSEIIAPGENGFLAVGEPEWRDALDRLIADSELRGCFGAAGRRRIEERYSLQVHAPRLVEALLALPL